MTEPVPLPLYAAMAKDRSKQSARAERDQRLAAALRENLRRRKAQQRGRAGPTAEGGPEPEPVEESAPGASSGEER